MALLQRKSISATQQQDVVSMVLTSNWECALSFQTATTQAVAVAF